MAKRLSMLQLQAIELIVKGLKDKEVCFALDITHGTLRNWLEQEEFQNKLDKEVKAKFSRLASKALRGLENLMFSRNEQIQLKTYQDILDRAGFKAPSVATNVNVDGSNLTPTEQTKQVVKKALELYGNGNKEKNNENPQEG